MAKLEKIGDQYIITKPTLTHLQQMDLNAGVVFDVHMRVIDHNAMTDQQRKFIFVLCKQYEQHTGIDSELFRYDVMDTVNQQLGIETEPTLQGASRKYAYLVINSIIHILIMQHIPLNAKTLHDYEHQFSERQIYMMTLHRMCAVDGTINADIHHVDAVGMGANRDKISHLGMRALPLSRDRHIECHTIGDKAFIEKYHLTPITIDKRIEQRIKRGLLRLHHDDEMELIEKGANENEKK